MSSSAMQVATAHYHTVRGDWRYCKQMEKIRLINQCNEMYELGKEMLGESGWSIWLGDTDGYFAKLRKYCKYNNQCKVLLNEQFKQNQLIFVRSRKIPDIHYEDFTISRFWSSILFPLSFLIEVKAIRYVSYTRDKISEANTIYGSLSALLKNLE